MGLPAIVNAEGKGLFRSIMRMHRTKLPQTMRSLGDAYVRKEFRLHYKPEVEGKHRTMFVGEWKKYVAMISSQEDVVGQELTSDQRGKLNDDQKKQLGELEKTAKSL
ncbi:unnamed protein product [Prorocentrum cordatum]|uniref:Succinate dehydrogenase assembly factor 3 n=1 Tax=Prorocentrum cordatum TaxID=2364126 RepID=A0ABN9XE90_9DINO|nr:unnamed protein product [Polarella glacialis]